MYFTIKLNLLPGNLFMNIQVIILINKGILM